MAWWCPTTSFLISPLKEIGFSNIIYQWWMRKLEHLFINIENSGKEFEKNNFNVPSYKRKNVSTARDRYNIFIWTSTSIIAQTTTMGLYDIMWPISCVNLLTVNTRNIPPPSAGSNDNIIRYTCARVFD